MIIILGIFFITVMALIFIYAAWQKKLTPATSTFQAQDSDRPKAETESVSYDFGEIKVADIKQQDFTLKNAGSKPLQILNINSSCNCTFGQIIYKDLISKEYGMHAQSGYVIDIAPGDTATVRVTYKPIIMPVYGFVERAVFITTNDPANQRLVFSVKAIVK